jgi:hypothetical protein
MREILTDRMLHEIFKALEKGEQYEYSDANTQISINPHGISIQYKTSTDTREVEDFLRYCDNLDDELFIEVCESFEADELAKLQDQLDTPSYKETISTFTQRVKEIAHSRLTEIINAADAEIKRQEQIMADARQAIEDIHKELDAANAKYNV